MGGISARGFSTYPNVFRLKFLVGVSNKSTWTASGSNYGTANGKQKNTSSNYLLPYLSESSLPWYLPTEGRNRAMVERELCSTNVKANVSVPNS